MAAEIALRRGVSADYRHKRNDKWEHWVAFCQAGAGPGRPYDAYAFSLRKFRLFGGWLIESGVTTAVCFTPWQSAVNWGFAQAEMGRPARGWDVKQAVDEWNAEQRSRSTRQALVREPTTAMYVRRLVHLGRESESGSVQLRWCAVLLLMALYGMRAATLGGCQKGDVRFVGRTLVFAFRCVKKWPELRERPAPRERQWPTDSRHPRAMVLAVIRRAWRTDHDFVCTALLQAMPVATRAVPHEKFVDALERQASASITKAMRSLIPDPGRFGVRMGAGTVVASHSFRIMFSSACAAVPYVEERVLRDAFWRSPESRKPYVRPFAFSQWLALLYDHLA